MFFLLFGPYPYVTLSKWEHFTHLFIPSFSTINTSSAVIKALFPALTSRVSSAKSFKMDHQRICYSLAVSSDFSKVHYIDGYL